MNHLDIINRALVAAGTNPRTLENMTEDDDNEVSSIKAYYESCWRDVLSAHPWSQLLEEEILTGEAEGVMYRFNLPEQCIRIASIYNSYGQEALDVKRRGRYLYSRYDQLSLTFVSTSMILPIDWDFLDNEIEADIPPAVDEVVSLRLSSQIVFRVSQNQDLQTHLHNRYIVALQNAKMNDMHGSGGQDPWTGVEYDEDII